MRARAADDSVSVPRVGRRVWRKRGCRRKERKKKKKTQTRWAPGTRGQKNNTRTADSRDPLVVGPRRRRRRRGKHFITLHEPLRVYAAAARRVDKKKNASRARGANRALAARHGAAPPPSPPAECGLGNRKKDRRAARKGLNAGA